MRCAGLTHDIWPHGGKAARSGKKVSRREFSVRWSSAFLFSLGVFVEMHKFA